MGAFLALAWSERRRPLRRHTESKARRGARNAALASMSAVALLLASALVIPSVERRQWGVLSRSGLPLWIEIPVAALALDYSMYLWHVLLHRVPLLWRFHLVHHADLDLDVSTAFRFHFGEVLLSIPLSAAQLLAIGPSSLAFSVWQTFFALSVMFHHSAVELPIEIERCLVRFAPRMHGIHHSIVQSETESNWSSGLTIWDRLHGTLRLNVPQREVTIGVPARRSPGELSLRRMIRMPFEAQRPSWTLPDGRKPSRASAAGPADLSA